MPCRCDYADEMNAEERSQEIDQLTQDLCFLCGNLIEQELFLKIASPRIRWWWKNHHIDDTKRVKQTMFDTLELYWDDNVDILGSVALAQNAIKAAKKVHSVSQFHETWFYRLAEETRSLWVSKKTHEIGTFTEQANKRLAKLQQQAKLEDNAK